MPYGGTPMKRGRGRPPKETDHVIHTDGTYSNSPSVESIPTPKPKTKRPVAGSVFKTKAGVQYQLVHEVDWGVYVYGYPHDTQPRVQDCTFWDNEKLEEEVG